VDEERLDRLIAAEQDERRRIALFLHDGPVQDLSGIALMLDATLHSIQTGRLEDAEKVLTTALNRQRSTIRQLRGLSFALEPVVLRDQGFRPALEALVEQLGEANRLEIELDLVEADRLGETAQVALYTIIRELIEQSVRRGPPKAISVSMSPTADGGIETRVSDDAEPERRRRSFEAIEERVRQLHGSIDVVVEDARTTVRVALPSYATRR
jgi:signal transduction histidine kinase